MCRFYRLSFAKAFTENQLTPMFGVDHHTLLIELEQEANFYVRGFTRNADRRRDTRG